MCRLAYHLNKKLVSVNTVGELINLIITVTRFDEYVEGGVMSFLLMYMQSLKFSP